MTERWKRNLALLDSLDPDVGKLRASASRGIASAEPNVEISRRPAIIAFSMALAVLALAFVFVALRKVEPAVPAGQPSGSVKSGGTYDLTVLEVGSSPEDAVGQFGAFVKFGWSWTSTTYPGEADCRVRLFDESGALLSVHETGFAAFQPAGEGRFGGIEIPEGSNPVDAEVTCGPGMVFVGSSYVFSNLRVEGGHVVGDVSWSSGTPVGDAACAVRIIKSDGAEVVKPFTLGVGEGTDTQLTPNILEGVEDGTPAEIRCEPYREPTQETAEHWLPWGGMGGDGTTVPTAEDIVAGATPLGDELAKQLGLEPQPSFEDALPCSYFTEVDGNGGYCLEGLSGGEDDLYAISLALRGQRITADELTTIRATLAHLSPVCDGHPVTVFAVEAGEVYQGTPEADYVAMVSGAQFEGRGGEDVICGPDGRVEGRLHDGEWQDSSAAGGGP